MRPLPLSPCIIVILSCQSHYNAIWWSRRNGVVSGKCKKQSTYISKILQYLNYPPVKFQRNTVENIQSIHIIHTLAAQVDFLKSKLWQ